MKIRNNAFAGTCLSYKVNPDQQQQLKHKQIFNWFNMHEWSSL